MTGLLAEIIGGVVRQLAANGARELGEAVGGRFGGFVASVAAKVAFDEVVADDHGAEVDSGAVSIVPSMTTGEPLQRSEVFGALFGPGAGG